MKKNGNFSSVSEKNQPLIFGVPWQVVFTVDSGWRLKKRRKVAIFLISMTDIAPTNIPGSGNSVSP